MKNLFGSKELRCLFNEGVRGIIFMSDIDGLTSEISKGSFISTNPVYTGSGSVNSKKGNKIRNHGKNLFWIYQ